MTTRNIMVITTSALNAANKLYPPGEWAPYPFGAKPADSSKPGLPLSMIRKFLYNTPNQKIPVDSR
jgi:hypothetical protein